jgi:hypothetical protein
VDPCESCIPIELSNAEAFVVLDAVEAIWGHRDLSRLHPEAPLFVDPDEQRSGSARQDPTMGPVVGLLPVGVLSDLVTSRLQGSATADPSTFVQRLRNDAPTAIVIDLHTAASSREAIVRAVDEAIGALHQSEALTEAHR